MKTLADEIFDILTPKPMALAIVGSVLGADNASLRRAAQVLNDTGRARILRKSRVLHIVNNGYAGRICRNCYVDFTPPVSQSGKRSDRQTCSRACHAAWGWKSKPGAREIRLASIRAAQSTPRALERMEAQNKRRWSKPGERERMSEQNRRQWADPKKAAQRAAAIRAVHGSTEMRKHYSEMRKADWRNEEFRGKTVKAMRQKQSSPETRKRHSEANLRRYRGEQREKYLAASRRNIAKATAAIKGKKKSAETRLRMSQGMRRAKRASKPGPTKSMTDSR